MKMQNNWYHPLIVEAFWPVESGYSISIIQAASDGQMCCQASKHVSLASSTVSRDAPAKQTLLSRSGIGQTSLIHIKQFSVCVKYI